MTTVGRGYEFDGLTHQQEEDVKNIIRTAVPILIERDIEQLKSAFKKMFEDEKNMNLEMRNGLLDALQQYHRDYEDQQKQNEHRFLKQAEQTKLIHDELSDEVQYLKVRLGMPSGAAMKTLKSGFKTKNRPAPKLSLVQRLENL